MPRKPSTRLQKKATKTQKKRAKTAKKLERKGLEKSLSTHGVGALRPEEQHALALGLMGKKDISSPEKYKEAIEGMGSKKISQRQRKKLVKKSKYTPRKPKRK
jgi:hypothetical protein